jgi:signal peptidase I
MERWAEKEVVELLKTEKKPCPITIVGQSMHPFIKDGSQVMIAPVCATEIRIGDIIAFVDDNGDNRTLVCHRVVGRLWRNGELFLREKGDNGRRLTMVPAKEVLGKVISIERDGKQISLEDSIQRMLGFGRAVYSQFKLKVATLIAKT